MTSDSRLSGFYRMDLAARLAALTERGALSGDDAARLARGEYVLDCDTADRMVENVIGVFGLPLAVAANFLVNGRPCLVPMVVEEPSVVAGASGAAKLARAAGGFRVDAGESLLIGQIQLLDVDDPGGVIRRLEAENEELKRFANEQQPNLLRRGGGVREIEYHRYRCPDGRPTVVVHLLVDTCDAMGANLVNSICEDVAPRIEALSGARAVLKILSNLADRSLVTARAEFPLDVLGNASYAPEYVREGIAAAAALAAVDPHRAATHNKGIMNGIDAVAIATGNDWRAIEAGAHAYAARDGAYRALSRWSASADGGLRGELCLPLKVGIAGGSLRTNPAVAVAQRIAGVTSSRDLAQLMGAVGLAQNFAALHALVTHGIQKGHMMLHARSVAAGAGAPAARFDEVVRALIESGDIKAWKAEELVSGLPAGGPGAAGPTVADMVDTACGKVILLGEHAAVYDKHVLALPIPDAVGATVTESEAGCRVTAPDWGIDQPVDTNIPEPGAAKAIALIMRELGVAHRHFSVQVRAAIPAGMGLGGSAAFAVAVIRAFNRLLGCGLDQQAIDRLAFECERLAHGTPSGIDNYIATRGEPVLYRRSTAAQTRAIPLTGMPPLVIAASSERGITKEQVAGVRGRYERNPTLYSRIFSAIDELSVAGAAALRDGDYVALGAMMNVCQGFLNAIGVSTPELESMVHVAREHGAAGAKLTGAGGGGSIVALCPGCVEGVAEALSRAGYEILRKSG